MSDSPIIPLNKNQEDIFVYQIWQCLRVFPYPTDDGTEAYQKYLSEHTRMSNQALLDLGARHIRLRMTDEMISEARAFRLIAREADLGIDEKKTESEIWASLHWETLWAWMEPYVTGAIVMNTSYLQEYRNTRKRIDDFEQRAAFLAENALLEAVAPIFKEFPKAAFIALRVLWGAADWRLGETGFEAPSFESAKGYGDFEQDSWQRQALTGFTTCIQEFDLFGDFEPGEYIITRDRITRQ